jgi:hypothetical protein
MSAFGGKANIGHVLAAIDCEHNKKRCFLRKMRCRTVCF